ncbi:AMP-binding protein [Longispora sp. K20-0274]|uniref:AMP-binding protein n=1 Tax=Longispora sp. K20-0274 TaxID=3088255 RepID=UPI00399BAECF
MNTPAELVAPGARLVDGATGDDVPVEGDLDLPEGLIFARTGLTVAAVRRYLAAFAARRPVAVLDPALDPAILADLIRRFEPAAVLGADPDDAPAGYSRADLGGPAWVRDTPSEHVPHPDLAVLLATSGSTGDPKLVRLSRAGVLHNAAAIAAVLDIDRHDVAPTSLPLFYSFGLSVLHSHLVSGATVLVVDGGVLARPFWDAVDRHGATSLAGVPYSYEMLAKIRWTPAKHPTLRSLTQAGGRLRDELIARFAGQVDRFHVMWGQTEAGPRMTTLPADRVADKLGSVGLPLPGGRVAIENGEVVYTGPNVMMGYAETAADLARGDDLGGVLHTGDLGFLDEDGFLWLKGRTKRFGKVFGVRLNLDDIEAILADLGPVAAVSGPDKVLVYSEGPVDGIVPRLVERLKLHRTGFEAHRVDRLPLLPNGKIDYRGLAG